MRLSHLLLFLFSSILLLSRSWGFIFFKEWSCNCLECAAWGIMAFEAWGVQLLYLGLVDQCRVFDNFFVFIEIRKVIPCVVWDSLGCLNRRLLCCFLMVIMTWVALLFWLSYYVMIIVWVFANRFLIILVDLFRDLVKWFFPTLVECETVLSEQSDGGRRCSMAKILLSNWALSPIGKGATPIAQKFL